MLVWLLGRDIVGGFQALIAVLALEGLHFFNFSVPKFAHDQMQLPFWALTGLFLYRAIARERVLDWLPPAPRSRSASGRNTQPSRSPAASACSCCSSRPRGAPC